MEGKDSDEGKEETRHPVGKGGPHGCGMKESKPRRAGNLAESSFRKTERAPLRAVKASEKKLGRVIAIRLEKNHIATTDPCKFLDGFKGVL